MTGLDADKIRGSLAAQSCLDQIEIFKRVDSTNTYLKGQPSPAPGRFRVAIAEHQTAGRGRHDRHWISAPGKSLCLSVSYRFVDNPDELQSLTLALGVSVAEALEKMGVDGVGVKWPNDILVSRSKLGGILTEAQVRGDSDVTVIVGVGLNIDLAQVLDADQVSDWAHTATDLTTAMSAPPSRPDLSRLVIDALFDACRGFERAGFGGFLDRFDRYDALKGRTVVVETPESIATGTGRGVDATGALRLQTPDGEKIIVTGSVKHIDEPGPIQ